MVQKPPPEESGVAKKSAIEWAKPLGLFGIIVADFVGFPALLIGLGVWGVNKHGWPLWLAGLLGLSGFGIACWRLLKLLRKT